MLIKPVWAQVETALGEIPTEPTTFVTWILARAIAVGGGIALILIIFGSYQVITSAGDPEKAQKGRETITAAVSGLIFIILSLFLLQLVGVSLFHLPEFNQP